MCQSLGAVSVERRVMIWRRGYSTEIQTDMPLSVDLANGAYLVAHNLEELTALGIWIRLLDQAAIPFCCLYVGIEKNFEDLVPPSLLRRISRFPDPFPLSVTSFVAIVVFDQVAKVAMIGAPTEDAWEQFENQYRTVLES